MTWQCVWSTGLLGDLETTYTLLDRTGWKRWVMLNTTNSIKRLNATTWVSIVFPLTVYIYWWDQSIRTTSSVSKTLLCDTVMKPGAFTVTVCFSDRDTCSLPLSPVCPCRLSHGAVHPVVHHHARQTAHPEQPVWDRHTVSAKQIWRQHKTGSGNPQSTTLHLEKPQNKSFTPTWGYSHLRGIV